MRRMPAKIFCHLGINEPESNRSSLSLKLTNKRTGRSAFEKLTNPPESNKKFVNFGLFVNNRRTPLTKSGRWVEAFTDLTSHYKWNKFRCPCNARFRGRSAILTPVQLVWFQIYSWTVSTLERVESTIFPSLYALPFYDFDLRASHARTLLPAALASVPFGFVLVRVRVRVNQK